MIIGAFARTFIVGSWNGQVIFDEPMVTRDFILAQRSVAATAKNIPLPAAKRYVPAGYYPASYGIKWDETAGEYRIALQGPELARLTRRRREVIPEAGPQGGLVASADPRIAGLATGS